MTTTTTEARLGGTGLTGPAPELAGTGVGTAPARRAGERVARARQRLPRLGLHILFVSAVIGSWQLASAACSTPW